MKYATFGFFLDMFKDSRFYGLPSRVNYLLAVDNFVAISLNCPF